MIADLAIVLDDRTCVDDDVLPDFRVRIDDGTGEHDDAGLQLRPGAHRRTGVDDRDRLCVPRCLALHDVAPGAIGSDRRDEAIDVVITPG